MSEYFTPPTTFNLSSYLLDHNLEDKRGLRDALHCQEGIWDYQKIAIHANRFAHLLLEHGVRPEERILLAVDDSADFVAAWLGILKVGAVVVMLNPHLDQERIYQLITYSRTRCAIVQKDYTKHWLDACQMKLQNNADDIDPSFHLHSIIQVLGGSRTHLPKDPDHLSISLPSHFANPYQYPTLSLHQNTWSNSDDTVPHCIDFEVCISQLSIHHICYPSHRDDPAVWLFSGGTTGKPKAIVQPHRSFVYTTERYAKNCIKYNQDDRVISIPKLYFGYATGANLIFPFAVGASSILFAQKPSVELLFSLIQKYRPTLMINVPTIINRMIKHPQAHQQDFSMLRLVTSAGEALPISLHEAWNELFHVDLYDGLGTAEMWHIFLSNHAGATKKGSLGQVVDGFEIYLKDAQGKDVALGEVGLMWVKGGARALRYWQQQTESEKVFHGDFYHSADLLRQDVDGFYYYCGRQDDMVKVAGKWVAPKEVEDSLMQHLLVKECAVVAHKDENDLLKIFAHVIVNTNDQASDDYTTVLMKHLKQELDSYKLPKRITICTHFKRTHLGKIDRKALKS
jgi:acyl-coenzyme A synthetase/AMP-(fatty) acid ligase